MCEYVAIGTENIYAYGGKSERLQGMLLMAHGDSIMATQKSFAITASFLAYRECIE